MMLKVLNLFVIDRIFESIKSYGLSSSDKMVYISCLIHHFKNLEASKNNSMAFKIYKKDLDWSKFEPVMRNLEKATLVTIDKEIVYFNNFWSPYINPKELEQKTPEIESKPKNIDQFAKDLLENTSMLELLQLKYKISKIMTEKMITLFVTEKKAINAEYTDAGAFSKHFIYWVADNHNKVASTKVKSENKILGL